MPGSCINLMISRPATWEDVEFWKSNFTECSSLYQQVFHGLCVKWAGCSATASSVFIKRQLGVVLLMVHQVFIGVFHHFQRKQYLIMCQTYNSCGCYVLILVLIRSRYKEYWFPIEFKDRNFNYKMTQGARTSAIILA